MTELNLLDDADCEEEAEAFRDAVSAAAAAWGKASYLLSCALTVEQERVVRDVITAVQNFIASVMPLFMQIPGVPPRAVRPKVAGRAIAGRGKPRVETPYSAAVKAFAELYESLGDYLTMPNRLNDEQRRAANGALDKLAAFMQVSFRTTATDQATAA